MGDAQSAQREGKKDAAAEEESGKVDDALTEQAAEDKPLKNTGQISELNGKADGSIAEVNGHCKDEIAAEAILTPDEDVSETEKPLQEEVKPLENVEINEKTSPDEADANEDVPLEMTEMDAKQNDINDGFRKFFSNIGLKLTVKRGSVDTATDVPEKTNKEEASIPEEVEDAAKESKSETAEQNTDVNIAQETYDNDSTTCPTMTDATSEDVVENAEEKTTETKEEVESHDADAATSSVGEDAHQEATPEEEPQETSPSDADVDAVSPIKRFFTTGIFSGLGKKKKRPAEDETTEKELVDMGKKEVTETTEQSAEDQQQDKEEFTLGVEADAVEAEHEENELKEEIASAQVKDEGKSSSRDLSEMSPQEKEKVQSSPLKRLLSGSSFKKLPKKQRSRRSSDTKLSNSGEHVSDQLLSSTESAENRKQESPEQPSAEAGEEDGAWASFKKLMTPKKRVKRSSLTNEDTQISVPVEPKPSEGEQISDHSTEEGKKRKDSSVSWEAVLCGSGRRRSRKTSDSEDETPQIDNTDHKQGGGSKHGAESPLEGSNEQDVIASSPKQAGSPSESDGGSTWNSLKRLVTPKRKAKDEDDGKEIIQSDSEVTQDESSFSLKKLLPGRKKRKSAEKQDRASSDEADRDVASGDEDSETPAVVPMSEFDTVETEVHIQTQADIESHIPEEASYELQKDLPDQTAEPVLPCESLQTEANAVPDHYAALEKQVPAAPAANTEPDDETESTTSHPQLSDIPEEGIITDTMVTPASVAGEAARDDTLAEDLIEITSEAITAPEPVSGITLADETEMISAVSQLSSESSKTSGNTTPVPAEYEVEETDALLYQVVETISISPKSVPVCSDKPRSEQIVGSASNQILEKYEIEEPTILEIHKKLDAGLNVEELDAINELATTSQTESTSEVVSEVTTEEFNTAEIPVDEKQGVSVTHPEESVKECEQIDESHHQVEGLSEMDAAVPTDTLMKINESSAVQGDILDSEEGVVRSQEEISEDILAAETVTDELKEETEPGEEDEQVQDAAKMEQVQVPEELEAVQASTLESEETSVQSPEEEVKSEDSPPAETVTDEPKQTAEHLTEVSVEPENKELPVKAVRTEHVEEPQVLEAVQEPILDSVDGSVQSLEKEAIVDLPKAETVTCEPKHETVPLNEPVDASKTDDVQEPEVLQAVQAPVSEEKLPVELAKSEHIQEQVLESVQASTLDSEVSSVKSLEKEVISADVPEAETVIDEPKEEKIPLTEAEDVSKTEDVQEPEVLQAVQTAISNAGSLLSFEKEETSEDIPAEETVTDELKQEAEVEVEPEEKLTLEVAKSEHMQEPQELEAVQASTLDSEDSSVEKEVISVDVPEAETVTDEPKEEKIPLTEPEDVSKTEDVQEPEVLQAVGTPTPDTGGFPSLEKEQTSEEIPAEETVTDEPKQEAEVEVEPEEKLTLEVAKSEHIQEPQVLESVQASTLDSEDSSVISLEKEVISADVPEAETVKDEPKEEKIPLTEPEDDSKTEDVQEPEVLQAVQTATSDAGDFPSLEKEETSEDIPAEETVTDEPNLEAKVEVEPEEKLTLEVAKTEEEEHKVLPSNVKETKTKEVVLQSHTVTEEETLSEDIPKPDADNLIASVADEIESKVLPQLDQALEKTEDQETESISKDVQVEQEDSIPEGVDELQTAVQVSSVTEEASNVQDLGKTVFSGETAALCVTEEPKHGMQLSEVQESVEEGIESKIPDSEIKTAEVEPALVAPVVVCDLKGVLVAVTDVLIEKTSEMTEPLKETIASEVVLKEEVEAAVPLGKEDMAETTGEVEMMHVPSVTLEEDHRSQVQVVDADTKSAETEGGVTDTEEVTDVCNEMGKNVDNLSAAPEVEEELIHEEHKVTIQEVTQHVEEELPETEPESVVANLEQEVIEQPLAVTKISEMAESESNDVEDQTAAEESIESSRDRQDEATAVISDESATEAQVSKDLMQTPDLPESLDASIHDHKEDLEQTEAEQGKLQVGIPGKEVKSSSEEAQIMQVSQSTIVSPSNTGLVIPQNTGIISSVGNVESPSSLSLEFKLNIQFGQAKAPFSPPPATERIAPVNQTAVPDAEEPVKPINPTQTPESQKQTELTSVGVQAVEITEATAKLDSNENGVIMPQPVLQGVGIQVMETVQPVEQIESTETVTCSVQATETIHPIRPTEQREVFVSQEVLCKDHDQETKEEEPVKKIEEENDQDVWMDAEEVIYTQEKTEVFLEVNEPLEPQTGSDQEEETGLGREAEMAPDSKTAEEESLQEMQKTEGNCDVESEGEDFAVALEDLEPASVSVTTMDFD
ncbi:A-kinase anchor protein 12 [Acanthopagrus latus]|uniref:A-kinase anchor protein 12 n=1 Tax=Acanthopagrus latus TaxID=8177 RepID=UPI00187BDBF6|nr:A-kinase anchor protein 12 [Acanthopagrus latus]